MKKFAECFLISLFVASAVVVGGVILLIGPTVIGVYGHPILAATLYFLEFVLLVSIAVYTEVS